LERMRPQLFAVKPFWIGFSCRNSPFCHAFLSGRVPLCLILTFCAHEHVLVENTLESA